VCIQAARIELIGILQLAHQQRRIAQAEIQAVRIEILRILHTGARGIAVEHGKQQGQLIGEFRAGADAERAQREGRAAGGKVNTRDRRPAESGVEQAAGIFAVVELNVGAELPEPQRDISESLFDPQLIKARVIDRLDIAHRHQVAEIFARKSVAVTVDDVGVELRARPAEQFFQIGIDAEIEAAVVYRAAPDAARPIAEHLAGVRKARPDAIGLERVVQLPQRAGRKRAAAAVIGGRILRPYGPAAECGADHKHRAGRSQPTKDHRRHDFPNAAATINRGAAAATCIYWNRSKTVHNPARAGHPRSLAAAPARGERPLAQAA
jgi:hypothetical protein